MMSFDMSAVGITLTILLAGILAAGGFGLWVLLGRRHWLAWAIGAVVGGLASVPLIEEVVIATQFERLCRDAGMHVLKRVEVEGFLDATHASSSIGYRDGPYDLPEAVAAFDRAGFQFREHLLDNGKIRHLERTPEGLWQSILDRPHARYHYKHAYQPTPHRTEEPVGWQVEKTEMLVVDSATGEVIGRDTRFKRRPSAIEGRVIGLFGSGLEFCSGPLDQPGNNRGLGLGGLIYEHVLVPSSTDKR